MPMVIQLARRVLGRPMNQFVVFIVDESFDSGVKRLGHLGWLRDKFLGTVARCERLQAVNILFKVEDDSAMENPLDQVARGRRR